MIGSLTIGTVARLRPVPWAARGDSTLALPEYGPGDDMVSGHQVYWVVPSAFSEIAFPFSTTV